MIRISFKGRLGNQMFQYAMMQTYKTKGIKIVPELSFYNDHEDQFELTDAFKIVDKKDFKFDSEKSFVQKAYDSYFFHLYNKTGRRYEEKENGVYDEKMQAVNNGNLIGYWQSEKYFIQISADIKKTFCFDIHDPKVLELGESLKKKSNSVAIHVRRADYLSESELGGVCTLSYYKRAMNYLREHIKNPTFYVFSDDIEWCKENLDREDVVFLDSSSITNYHNWYDMYFMSKCNHNIIANSSFSWWGAWINDNKQKIVIAPDRWTKSEKRSNVYCDGWIKLESRE